MAHAESTTTSSGPDRLTRLAPDGVAPAHGYSQVVVGEGRLVLVAGQIATDEQGSMVGAGDPGEQVRQVFHNIDVCLAAAGATFADVVKLTYYVTDLTVLIGVGNGLRTYLDPDRLPTSTAVQVQALLHPDAVIEVDAMALVAEA